MNKFILIALIGAAQIGSARAQDAPSAPNASSDMEALRQQVQSLTEAVKTLQQQVKDQQTTISGFSPPNNTPAENGGTAPVPSTLDQAPDGAVPSSPAAPSPSATAKPTAAKFPTEDASVVASGGTPA